MLKSNSEKIVKSSLRPSKLWNINQSISQSSYWKLAVFSIIKISFLRVSLGFLLSVIVAIPLRISMGTFATVRALFEPLIAILRYMPAPAFIPLLIIYLGIDEAPKITLIFIGTVFFNILMIMDSVKA